MNSLSFNPGYTWRSATIPFRIYLEHPRCRIFIIDNILHNYNWIEKYNRYFRETDIFFIHCTWFFSSHLAKKTDEMFSFLSLNKDNFFFLFNSPTEKLNLEAFGFQGDLINHNCWLDHNYVVKPLNLDKLYHAIYVGRRTSFKRHMLASKVSSLALVAGHNHGNSVADIPPHAYLNSKQLTPEEVCTKINESYCGLILSESEGACYSSSEYLLCGVPVVSTPSTGGRDVWYDDYNSIISEPNPDAIASAVEEIVRNPRDPLKIRKRHIELSMLYRDKFVSALADVLSRHSIYDISAKNFFLHSYIHKLRVNCIPDFHNIWMAPA
jgi:hypothetical protein